MIRLGLTYILWVVISLGCKENPNEPISFVDINYVSIQQSILQDLQKSLKQEPVDFEVSRSEPNGFYFADVKEKLAKRVVMKHADKVTANGNYIFLKNLDFDDNWNSTYDVAVIRAKDQFDVLKIMGTHGGNYDISNEQVIAQLKEWDQQIGLDIIVVDENRVEAHMKRVPDNLEQFAEAVYEFSPDVIHQGYEDISLMIEDYKSNKYFWLWWD